jgi:E3 ubiquitin-protein ligase RGLG
MTLTNPLHKVEVRSDFFESFIMQFVNFTEIMAKNVNPQQKEAAFALAALMEIPSQFKAAVNFNLLK